MGGTQRIKTAKKIKPPPMVAESKGLEVAKRAAEAVGLTVEQLADLMVDQGVTALPPEDALTKRYTLEDLGQRLWHELQGHPPTARASWFQGLADVQKVGVIVVLRNRGFTSQAIGHDFGIDVKKVQSTYNAYAADVGAQVVGLRLDTIAGQLQIVSEKAQHMAIEAGDHSALWKIEKEKVATLQSLGIVDRAIHRVEVTHKVEEEKMAEIHALVTLEKKRDQRAIEIAGHKEVEASDPVPQDVRATEDIEDDEEEG